MTARRCLSLQPPGRKTTSDKAASPGGRVDIGADEFMTAWQAWRDQHFGLPDGGVNAGPLHDPEHDGTSNLLEYSQGANPNVPDPQFLPALNLMGSSLRFFYRKAVSELTYAVEQDADLSGTWTLVTSYEQTDGAGLFWRDLPLTGDRGFFRLKVTQP